MKRKKTGPDSLDVQGLFRIFETTANRIFKRQYRYFVLDKRRISEFEARHVMTKVLEESKCPYGIELQTKEKHITNVGLVDLVIFDRGKRGARLGWVEFKRGAAPEEKILKDFEKMIREPGLRFASFFHIIPVPDCDAKKSTRNTAEAILNRYRNAHREALKKALNSKKPAVPKEFALFLLDCERGRYLMEHVDNILGELDFRSPKWNRIEYGVGGREIRWVSGKVDRGKEHIKLFYGDAEKEGWDEFKQVALLSPPMGMTFNVEFVVDANDAERDVMIEEVKHSLDYYLIELGEKNPWAYALYHCGTAANMYAMVHWAYYEKGESGSAFMSKVVRQGGDMWIFKPESGSKAKE